MVVKGDTIVVPVTLKHAILRHPPEGHMGLEKMLLRSAVFGMDLQHMLTT